MSETESHDEKMTRIARELGAALRLQAEGAWKTVRTSERGEKQAHAWRFRRTAKGSPRFLRVTHEAMEQGDDPVPLLLSHLGTGRWLDRLNSGETSLVLAAGGRLERGTER